MTVIASDISVAQAATIINAIITVIQFTLFASLTVVLIYLLPRTTTALAWSAISRTIHSSIWPTLLRSDSSTGESVRTSVLTISRLSLISTVLIALSGVILPLGLHQGPLLPSEPQMISAKYIHDDSPIGLATTSDRQNFLFGRVCGALAFVPCPGNPTNNSNVTTYAPSVVEIFNSTTYGPFNMQFRRFYNVPSQWGHRSQGIDGTAQSLILRDDIFAIEGLVVDMASDHPGIGFLNVTVPDFPTGGSWSQDVLWLDPITECVDTNLTADYILSNGPLNSTENYNITDHGGFYRLTQDQPSLNLDGQHIDLKQRAYTGAVMSNFDAMRFLNTSRESSHEGKNYTLNASTEGLSSSDLGKTTPLFLSYLNDTAQTDSDISCTGFGGADSIDPKNVHVSCGAFLAPPSRTDGGNPEVLDGGSHWSQHIHVCASTTRASIQTITLLTNSSSNLQNLQLHRQTSNKTVLWAMEKTNITIADIDPMWGWVDDRYENDSSLWTVRNPSFYLPAGSTSIAHILSAGEPVASHASVWGESYFSFTSTDHYIDYTGETNFAMKAKFVSMVEQNPTLGDARIRNIIWTDMMANNVLGTMTSRTLLAARNRPSLTYDFRYAIPGFLLLALWAPSFLAALTLLVTRTIRFKYMRRVLDHLSVGRVVVGSSLLRVQGQPEALASDELNTVQAESHIDAAANHSSDSLGEPSNTDNQHHEKSSWANTDNTTDVTLFLDRKASYEGLLHPS